MGWINGWLARHAGCVGYRGSNDGPSEMEGWFDTDGPMDSEGIEDGAWEDVGAGEMVRSGLDRAWVRNLVG